jgi:hypothetical protein
MMCTRTLLAVVGGVVLGFMARTVVVPAAAQAPGQERVVVPLAEQATLPTIYSGNDIGVRITGKDAAGPTARMMVRINGVWQEVKF